MLLIMVGNMASICTQVYIAKTTPIHSFFPYLMHIVLFTFLTSLESMWTFSWLFSFAAVTGSMYSGTCAFFFLDENPAINPIVI